MMTSLMTLAARTKNSRQLSAVSRFVAGTSGTTAVEYAVMLALVITVCVVALTAVGAATLDHYNTSQNALDSALNK